MKKILASLLFLSSGVMAAETTTVTDLMNDHLKQYASQEHFTAIQVSIKAGNKISHYAVGTRSIDKNSKPVSTDDLFDIGSITKSFTSTLVIKAHTEGKLDLNKSLGDYLKAYPHWGDVTLAGLLDMSTGIPNYSDSPTINYLFSKNLRQYWHQNQLIALAYPQKYNPPRVSGFFYSNTGYILLDMILSELYHNSYSQLLKDKIITPLGLKNTFYPVPNYSKDVLKRMVRGYAYNIYDNPELLGLDMTENNMSWAGAAGAIVANSADVLQWVYDLFESDRLLTDAEKKRMQTMYSISSGKPIEHTNADNPKSFALGISQGYDKEMGTYWFYEGKTLGYRALYMYSPDTHIIVVALFNSATNGENDKAGELMKKLYQYAVKL